jgi:hypothetical protein
MSDDYVDYRIKKILGELDELLTFVPFKHQAEINQLADSLRIKGRNSETVVRGKLSIANAEILKILEKVKNEAIKLPPCFVKREVQSLLLTEVAQKKEEKFADDEARLAELTQKKETQARLKEERRVESQGKERERKATYRLNQELRSQATSRCV